MHEGGNTNQHPPNPPQAPTSTGLLASSSLAAHPPTCSQVGIPPPCATGTPPRQNPPLATRTPGAHTRLATVSVLAPLRASKLSEKGAATPPTGTASRDVPGRWVTSTMLPSEKRAHTVTCARKAGSGGEGGTKPLTTAQLGMVVTRTAPPPPPGPTHPGPAQLPASWLPGPCAPKPQCAPSPRPQGTMPPSTNAPPSSTTCPPQDPGAHRGRHTLPHQVLARLPAQQRTVQRTGGPHGPP